jgi:coenzyme Q-binding protein COQ10
MPHHHERRHLPHSAEQMYNLVADVARYPEFLPWVSAIRIRKDEEDEMLADMIVGFKSLRETFSSRVVKTPHSSIVVDYLDGPMKHLHNAWTFEDIAADQLWISQSIFHSATVCLRHWPDNFLIQPCAK